MTIVVVGFNHRTAPVDLREQFFLSEYGVRMALDALRADDQPCRLDECAILSTCNRLEIYTVAGDPDAATERLIAFLASLHDRPVNDLRPHLYARIDDDAVEHLMRVACGLDSLILGESQILGQVGEAYDLALAAETSGPVISHLFTAALGAGKRARAETDISRFTVSVSHAAALLVKQHLGDLASRQVLVVGSGETAELAARALQIHGAMDLRVISRTYAHAELLANRLGIAALDWSRLASALIDADAVIAATAAPHPVIDVGQVSAALNARGQKPMLLVDVAVPRNIAVTVASLPNVHLYDIDDLQGVVDSHRAQREAAVEQVQAIIAAEQAAFADWLRSRRVVPLLVDLRRKAEALAEAEVEAALRRLPDLDARQQAIITRMARRIVNKMLHEPTVALKARAGNGFEYDYAQTVRELFGLPVDDGADQTERLPYG